MPQEKSVLWHENIKTRNVVLIQIKSLTEPRTAITCLIRGRTGEHFQFQLRCRLANIVIIDELLTNCWITFAFRDRFLLKSATSPYQDPPLQNSSFCQEISYRSANIDVDLHQAEMVNQSQSFPQAFYFWLYKMKHGTATDCIENSGRKWVVKRKHRVLPQFAVHKW